MEKPSKIVQVISLEKGSKTIKTKDGNGHENVPVVTIEVLDDKGQIWSGLVVDKGPWVWNRLWI